jgi:two-component system, NtrC family, sensor histidine kinase KinB
LPGCRNTLNTKLLIWLESLLCAILFWVKKVWQTLREDGKLMDTSRTSLKLLYDISRELVSSLDLNKVINRLLLLSTTKVGAERGTLIVLDDRLQPVDAAIVYNGKTIPHTLEQVSEILRHGLAGWVMQNRQPALLSDTSQDQRWMQRRDDALDRTGPKSAVCIPIVIAGDQLVGILTIVHPKTGFFNQDRFDLLQAIGEQAGVAINNARLYELLNEAHQRYRDLFEDSIDPIFITDWKGNIIEANRQAAQTSGYSLEELREKNIIELHAVNLDLLGDDFHNLQSRQMVQYESMIQAAKGTSSLPVDVHVRSVHITGSEFVQWILRDISERKALDSLREDLIAMIYHDLRAPLSNVISSLDMLKMLLPAQGDPAIQPVFAIAMRSSERLKRLINSLLDIHRIESGQKITTMENISASDLAADAIAEVAPIANAKQQVLSFTIPQDLSPIFADPDMIKRVLINLLENATKFTPQQGSIILGGEEEGEQIKLWVKDTGPGISPNVQEDIFNKFVRVKGENMPKGLGLGLAFCRLAVLAHGGKIWVESQLGNGSTFFLTLPKVQEIKK